MTKMAVMLICGKNLQKIFFYKSYYHETWHWALCTQSPHPWSTLYKRWPRVDLFYNNVKFGKTCFCTYSRPSYQMTVYRAIGPLVSILIWHWLTVLNIFSVICIFFKKKRKKKEKKKENFLSFITSLLYNLVSCNLSRNVRKPVFGVSDQVWHKSGCAASENG